MTDEHIDSEDDVVSSDVDEEDDEEDDDEVEPPEELRAALAEYLGADGQLFLEVAGTPVGGLIAFAAHQGRRSVAGVWDGSSIELDPDRAVQMLCDAWGYGPDRPVSARDVAAAVGTIEGKPGTPFLDQDAIELGGDPTTMTPPEEVEVDGQPGVRFWNGSSRLSPYPVTFVVGSDGRARVHRGHQ